MSLLDSVNITNLGVGSDLIKREYAKRIWEFFDSIQDEVIFKVGIGRFAYTKRIRDIKWIFERIAGGRPFAV